MVGRVIGGTKMHGMGGGGCSVPFEPWLKICVCPQLRKHGLVFPNTLLHYVFQIILENEDWVIKLLFCD